MTREEREQQRKASENISKIFNQLMQLKLDKDLKTHHKISIVRKESLDIPEVPKFDSHTINMWL
jgi:hypothetical protein